MKQDVNEYDVIIIGGGASGMMAAIAAKSQNPGGRVLLLERNDSLGRKLLATGNGRCNFTNVWASCADYGESADFTASVMERIPPEKVIELMADLGVLHRVEEEGRVYPYSGQGASVNLAMQRKLTRLGVDIRCNASVTKAAYAGLSAGVESSAGGGTSAGGGRFYITLTDETRFSSEKLIIAAGGKAGGQYGCSGDGYGLARHFGHDVTKVRPALSAVNCKDWNKSRKGVRARGKVSLWKTVKGEAGRPQPAEEQAVELVASESGEVQFTESGLSGICVFDLSRHIIYTGNMKEGRRETYFLSVDFFPDWSEEQVEILLRTRRKALGEQTADGLLLSVVHERLIDGLLHQAGISAESAAKIPADQKTGGTASLLWPAASAITGQQLRRLAGLLKDWRFEVEGTRGFNDAQVTAGGVCRTQVNPETMESRLQSGLYLCGEVLDVDGRCGGYNLQWAFASGYVAGCSAAQ